MKAKKKETIVKEVIDVINLILKEDAAQYLGMVLDFDLSSMIELTLQSSSYDVLYSATRFIGNIFASQDNYGIALF